MPTDEQIKSLYFKIFERSKNNSKTMYMRDSQIAFENKRARIRFLKEITQQLNNSGDVMIECFGNEIIDEVKKLKLKVKKTDRV